MKFCAIIPSYNHSETLAKVLETLPEQLFAIVVDDGSDVPIRINFPHAKVIRHQKNLGKASALKTGFSEARSLGFTHAITIDADGQHPTEFIAQMLSAAQNAPEKIIIAARDFENSSIPAQRKFMNKFSNFWFRVETGVVVNDTQCGFRCYPLDVLNRLDLRLGGFVFEVELLVKAAWSGVEFFEISIPAIYSKETLNKSHYRPIVDTLRFTAMNFRLFFASLFFSKSRLKRIADKK